MRVVPDPVQAAKLANQATEVWQRLARADGPGVWTVNQSEALRKLAITYLDGNDVPAAQLGIDQALALFDRPHDELGGPERQALSRLLEEGA